RRLTVWPGRRSVTAARFPPLIRLPPSAAAVESGDRVLCPSFALESATRNDSSGCHRRMFLVPAARAEERTSLLRVEPRLPAGAVQRVLDPAEPADRALTCRVGA